MPVRMRRKSADNTEDKLRKAARNHAAAMRSMHTAHKSVAITLGRLVAVMGEADDAPFGGGDIVQRADEAMGELGRAYERVAALFDAL